MTGQTDNTVGPDLSIITDQPAEALGVLLHLLTAAAETREIVCCGNRPNLDERARLGAAVDRASAFLGIPPGPSAADRAAAATVDPVDALIIERLGAAGLLDVPREECEPSPGLTSYIANIASLYRAVEYDAGDRPAERAAIIIAATRAGLLPIATEAITPRAMRGCPLPPVDIGAEAARLIAEVNSYAVPRAEVMEQLIGTGAVSGDVAQRIAVDAAIEAIRPVLDSLFAGGRATAKALA